ncbi:MAG: hypothetical protein LBL24_05970, partial [Bacteroidales bacterium]|nr:hypothetical protein [Bacteroidales bacterium]
MDRNTLRYCYPLGFATVTATQHDTESGGLPYRRTVQRYDNDNIYRQGLLREEATLTAAGDTLGRTVNIYRTLNPATMAPASYTRFFSGRLWTAPAQVTEYLYEEGGRLAMEKQFAHDAWGNVERYVETPGDDPAGQVTVTAAYRHDHSRYLHVLPESVEVASRGEGTLRRRRASYDERGNMTQLVQAIDAGGAEAVTDFTYDATGNITGVTRPANYKGQRLRYAFTYDDALHTLVTGVEDSYGYASSTEYDYRW